MDYPGLLLVVNFIGFASYVYWNHYSKKAISNRFDKSLLQHRTDLEKDLKQHQSNIDRLMAEANADLQKELKNFELMSSFELQKSNHMHDKRFDHIFEFITESSETLSRIIADLTEYYIARHDGDLNEIANTWVSIITSKNSLLMRAPFLFVYYDYDIVRAFRQNLIQVGSAISRLDKSDNRETVDSAVFLSVYSAASCLASLRHFSGVIAKEDYKGATLEIAQGLGLSVDNIKQAMQYQHERQP